MKILVIGKGGREHALAYACKRSALCDELICAPGNPGMAKIGECVDVKDNDVDGLVTLAKERNVDLTIVGPEATLALGVVDAFKKEGLKIFGPDKKATQVESSKDFAKKIMAKYNIPTAAYKTFYDLESAWAYVQEQGAPIVIKEDGLKAGKGVTVASTLEQAKEALDIAFAIENNSVVIEECLFGFEFSLICLVHNETVVPLEVAQDHKCVFDGDKGPNTGGMGSYSPVKKITSEIIDEAMHEIMKPMASAMVKEGVPFTGFLYGGLMLTEKGIKTIEFNARFGDPEAEVILPRLESDFVQAILDLMDNKPVELKWTDKVSHGVVLASTNYPASSTKGSLITGVDDVDGLVFHMGTKMTDEGLVTAINPTKAGEGKSTTTVGLGDALNRLGKKTMMALREPSLGPVFGLKGGATGGGYAQVVPMEDINLHFTGDMHAITTANNLVSACLDNVIHQGNELNIDPEKVTFKRCLDMNDRTLRNITIGCGAKANGVERKDGFNITVASEIMAALCLADDLMDLKKRFGKMLVAYTYDDKPVYVHDLGIEGALAMVMKDAVLPNVVQTLEHNPVLIHGGPFANIAHGCNSVIATKACLELADYTVTEAGFGADLGAEKFLDIKCRLANLKPNAVVIVATIRALKQHGGIALEDLKEENVEAMLAGCENLAKHIDTIQQFGLPYIVAINEFATDTPAEVAALEKWCEENNHPMSLSQVWAKGGEGAIDLANKVVALCDQENNYAPLYDLDKSIEEKVETIAKKVYGADGVDFTEEAQAQIAKFNELGWDKLPICMAKTQMSLSDDGKVMGRPTGFRITVRELRPSLGAGFIVALTGKVLTMPGLPKHPSALDMDVDENGKSVGLF